MVIQFGNRRLSRAVAAKKEMMSRLITGDSNRFNSVEYPNLITAGLSDPEILNSVNGNIS